MTTIKAYTNIPVLTPTVDWTWGKDMKWYHLAGYTIAVSIMFSLINAMVCKSCEEDENGSRTCPTCVTKWISTAGNTFINLILFYVFWTWVFSARFF